MKWRSGKLLHIILIYVMMSGINFWLPTVRGLFDGPSYTWSGWMGMGGSGIGGHYWALLAFTTLLITVIFLGWRGARKPFHWFLLLWFFLLLLESASWFFSSETVHFRGDTLGTDFPIGKIIFPMDLLFFSLAITWILRDLKSRQNRITPVWRNINRNFLFISLFLLPVQFTVLRFFDHITLLDQIGVLVTLLQWLLINLSFYPWRN